MSTGGDVDRGRSSAGDRQGSKAVDKVHTFGTQARLVGVLTSPPESVKKADAPTVLMLNAGLIHRVGPYRMHVELARRLAEGGWKVFRFDQSALGDSDSRRSMMSYEERAVADVQEAMDFLGTKVGSTRFVAMGVCSGAMNAHRAAAADPRIAGAVLIDGYSYKTLGYKLRHYPPRILSPTMIQNTLRRRLEDLRTTLADRFPILLGAGKAAPRAKTEEELPGADAMAIFEQAWPPQEQIAAELGKIARRGGELLFVYTGGGAESFNHLGQFAETFQDSEILRRSQVEFYPEADHTFTLLSHRAQLVERVERWMRDRF